MTPMRRRLLTVAGILAGLAFLAGATLWLFLPTGAVRDALVGWATQALGRPVTVGSVGVTWWGRPGVALRDLAVAAPVDGTGGPQVTVEAVEVRLALLPLLRGEYRATSLILHRPVIRWVETVAAGPAESDVAGAGEPGGAGPVEGGAPPLAVERLVISGGRLERLDADGGGWGVEDLEFDGQVDLTDPQAIRAGGTLAGARLTSRPVGAFPPLALSGRFELVWAPAAGTATLDPGEFVVNGARLRVTGQAGQTSAGPVVRVHLNADRVELAEVGAALTAAGVPVEMAGQAALTLELDHDPGRTDQPLRADGQLHVTGGRWRGAALAEPLEAVSADLTLRASGPAALSVEVAELSFRSPSSDGRLTGTVRLPLGGQLAGGAPAAPLRLTFRLAAGTLDLDRLLPATAPGPAPGPPAPSPPGGPGPGGGLPMADGVVAIDRLRVGGVELSAVQAKVRVRDGVVTLSELAGHGFGGSLTGQARADLRQPALPRYSGQVAVRQVEADRVLTQFTRFGGHLAGRVDLDATFDTVGPGTADLLDRLTLTGSTLITEGVVSTSGSLHTALDGAARLAGQRFLEQQPLRDLRTRLEVGEGRFWLRDLRAGLGPLGDIELDGYYAVDGGVGYQGALLLTEEATSRFLAQGGVGGTVARLLTGRGGGRIRLPLSITGSLAQPRVSVDAKAALADAAGNLVGERGGSILRNLLDRKRDRPETP